MNRVSLTMTVALGLTACGGEQRLYMQGIESPDVRVAPGKAVIRGDKLVVKVVVQNSSPSAISIVRDQIVARLPSGQTVTRAVGRPYGEGIWSYYGGGGWVTHEPYVLAPGATREVDVAFKEVGFDWRDITAVAIDFDGAITRGGAPVTLIASGRSLASGGSLVVSSSPFLPPRQP
jgi:hypothetical protein